MNAPPLEISSVRIVRVLSALAVLVIAASTLSQLGWHATGHGAFEGSSKLLSLDAERNVAAAFSSALLLCAALLLALVATLKRQRQQPFLWHWATLALGFAAMAVDEAMSFHEKLIGPLRNLLGNEDLGILYFAWVLPALVLLPVLALFFLRFLRRLPPRTARLFVLAGALYVGGALGMELVGGYYAEQRGMLDLTYATITTVEESLEIAGLIVFIHALLRYIAEQYGEVRIHVHQGR